MAKPRSSPSSLKVGCRWFRGDIDGQSQACVHYEPLTLDILINKLGAIGDVIRTPPFSDN